MKQLCLFFGSLLLVAAVGCGGGGDDQATSDPVQPPSDLAGGPVAESPSGEAVQEAVQVSFVVSGMR